MPRASYRSVRQPVSGSSTGFTRAFFRQTVYEETIAPRRLRLHQQVGRAIETVHTRRLQEHAAELAEHFGNSSNDEDLEKAVAYGQKATEQATSVYAHGDAVGHLEQCLEVQEVVDPSDETRRCDLLLALGEAVIPAAEPKRAYEILATEALRLARSIEDDHRASRACQVAVQGLRFDMGAASFGNPAMRWWNEQADIHARPGTTDRAHADLDLSTILLSEGRSEESWSAAMQAVDLAREISEPDLLLHAIGRILGRPCSAMHQEDRLRLAKELVAVPREGVSPGTLVLYIYWAGLAHLEVGKRGQANELWCEAVALAERTWAPNFRTGLLTHEAYIATLDGRLHEALTVIDAALTDADVMTNAVLEWLRWAKLRPLILLGEFDEVLSTLELLSEPMSDRRQLGIWLALFRVDALARMDREAEAIEELDKCLADQRIDDGMSSSILILLLDIALSFGRIELVERLATMLLPVDYLASSYYHFQCVARLLGEVAALLNKPDEARTHYAKAVDVANSIQNRPELALTHLDLAELLLNHYLAESDEAREHLEFALAECRDMKMRPSVEKAEALLARLDGSSKKTIQKYRDGLSAREVDVLRLIAAGNSNQQIADALYISPSTVAHHVTSTLTKTDSANRTEAATYASRNGLT